MDGAFQCWTHSVAIAWFEFLSSPLSVHVTGHRARASLGRCLGRYLGSLSAFAERGVITHTSHLTLLPTLSLARLIAPPYTIATGQVPLSTAILISILNHDAEPLPCDPAYSTDSYHPPYAELYNP